MKVLLFANIGTDSKGYYHVGDEAMFLQTYHFYQKFFPYTFLTCLVSKPLKRSLKIEQREGLGWPNTKQAARLYFFKLALKTFVYSKLKISLFTNEQLEFIKYIQSHKLVHLTGGGFLTSETEHWLYYALFIIFSAHFLKIPVIATSQTVGPFNSWVDKKVTTVVLNTINFLEIRTYTKNQKKFLRKNGVTKPKIVTNLDAAYLYNSKSLTLKPKDKKKIRIGLSLHAYKEYSNQVLKLLTVAVKMLYKAIPNIEFVVIPHIVNKKNEWDIAFTNQVLNSIPQSDVIRFNYSVLSKSKLELATYIKSLTKTCDCVLSSRYHGAVFALSENVPCLSITSGNYQKQKNEELTGFVFGSFSFTFTLEANTSTATDVCHRVVAVLKQKMRLKLFIAKRNQKLYKLYFRQRGIMKKAITKLLSSTRTFN